MVTRTYTFDEFQLDLVKRRLLRDGTEVTLNDNEFDLLVYLIENRPNVCLLDEIVTGIWRDAIVTVNSVEKAVVRLRKALGDDAKAPRYVRNRRGQGYVFIGDVVERNHEDENTKPERTAQQIVEGKAKLWAFVSGLALVSVLILGLTWLYGSSLLRSGHSSALFEDDFSTAELNGNQWESSGKTVRVEDGMLRLSVDETDNPGRVYSRFFPIDPTKVLVIKSRVKVSFSRNMKSETYFGGVFGLIQKSDAIDGLPAHQNSHEENRRFTGVRYMNYDSQESFTGYEGEVLQEVPTEGFFIVKDGGRPNARAEYQLGKISKRIDPIWDAWFEQTIELDPISGQLAYFTDGEKKGEFNVGPLNAKDDQIRLLILPWGWWVNHLMEIDYIRVSQ
jgi:DNA-binding winged helix-turn-helix (wHTH) protein